MEERISGIEEIDTGVKENVISKKFHFFPSETMVTQSLGSTI